jgi:hypothetical protein
LGNSRAKSSRKVLEGPPDIHLFIYDGRDCLGAIIEHAVGCDAFNAAGMHLGAFSKRKVAIAAINQSQSRGEP